MTDKFIDYYVVRESDGAKIFSIRLKNGQATDKREEYIAGKIRDMEDCEARGRVSFGKFIIRK